MRSHSLFLGYHGCSSTTAADILSGTTEHLQLSQNDYDWLGPGVYFWENSYTRALNWAQAHYKDPETPPAVLGAVFTPCNCLDLTTDEGNTLFKNFVSLIDTYPEILGTENEAAYKGDKLKKKRKLDCKIFQMLHEAIEIEEDLEPYDSIRGAFIEGNPVCPGSFIYDQTHIQWAITNPQKCIIGYFRPIV